MDMTDNPEHNSKSLNLSTDFPLESPNSPQNNDQNNDQNSTTKPLEPILDNQNDREIVTSLQDLSLEAVEQVSEIINTSKLANIQSFEDQVKSKLSDSYHTLHNEACGTIGELNGAISELWKYVDNYQNDIITFNTLVNTILTLLNNLYQLYTRFSTLVQHHYQSIHTIQHYTLSNAIQLVPFLPISLFTTHTPPTTSTLDKRNMPLSVDSIQELVNMRYLSKFDLTYYRHRFLKIVPKSIEGNLDKIITAFEEQSIVPMTLKSTVGIKVVGNKSGKNKNKLDKPDGNKIDQTKSQKGYNRNENDEEEKLSTQILKLRLDSAESKTMSYSDLLYQSNPSLFGGMSSNSIDSIEHNEKIVEKYIDFATATTATTATTANDEKDQQNNNSSNNKQNSSKDVKNNSQALITDFLTDDTTHLTTTLITTPQTFLFPLHLVDSILQFCTFSEILNLMSVSREWFFSIQQSTIFSTFLSSFTKILPKFTYSHSVTKSLNTSLKLPYMYTIPFELLFTPEWDSCASILVNLLNFPPNSLYHRTEKDRYSIQHNTVTEQSNKPPSRRSSLVKGDDVGEKSNQQSNQESNQEKKTPTPKITPTSTQHSPSNSNNEDVYTPSLTYQKIQEIYQKQQHSLQANFKNNFVISEKYLKSLDKKAQKGPTHPHYSVKININAESTGYNVDIVSMEYNEEQCQGEKAVSQQKNNTKNGEKSNENNTEKNTTIKTLCSKISSDELTANSRNILDLHLHGLSIELAKIQLNEELDSLRDKKYELSKTKTDLNNQNVKILTPAITTLIHQLESDEYTLKFLNEQLSTLDNKIIQAENSANERVKNLNLLIEQNSAKLKQFQQQQDQFQRIVGELSLHTKVLHKEVLTVSNNIKNGNNYLLFLQQMLFQLGNLDSIYFSFYEKNQHKVDPKDQNCENNHNNNQQQQHNFHSSGAISMTFSASSIEQQEQQPQLSQSLSQSQTNNGSGLYAQIVDYGDDGEETFF